MLKGFTVERGSEQDQEQQKQLRLMALVTPHRVPLETEQEG